MWKLLTVLVLSHAGYIFASPVFATQKCELFSQKGPYTSFDIQYHIDGEKLVSHKATVTIHYSKDAQSSDRKAVLNGIKLTKEKDRAEIKLHFDVNDRQTTEIALGEDDDGVAAFVNFFSDGPNLRSYYRCSKFPMDLEA